MICSKCTSAISSSQDAVSCVGCSRHFHANCEFTGSSTEIRGVLAVLRLRDNIVFVCTGCKQRIVYGNFSDLIEKLNGISIAPDVSKIEEDIATNRDLIESLSSKLNEMSSIISSTIPSSNRVLENNATPIYHQDSATPTPIDTFGSCVDNDLVAIDVPEVKHLYVGRLDPSTTADQVVEFICKKVDNCRPEDLTCRSLLKKDRPNEQRLTFISFKVTIPARCFTKTSDLTIWPQKVLVREFVQQSQNFRAPVPRFPTL